MKLHSLQPKSFTEPSSFGTFGRIPGIHPSHFVIISGVDLSMRKYNRDLN